MFRVGDKVVCINNMDSSVIVNKTYPMKDLCIGKIYTVSGVVNDMMNFFIVDGESLSYFSYRFIHLKEYRKKKLNKICLK